MQSSEIIEGNKLIAEFMGYNGVSSNGEPFDRDIDGIFIQLYSESWDWLMPVVEKIAKLKLKYENVDEYYNPYPLTFAMPDKEGNFMVRLFCTQVITEEKLIDATWKSVVEFLKDYNQNTKP